MEPPIAENRLDMPVFSIIMPVFNGVSYLREAVDSVRTQKFGDWELLAIDDGSSDGSRTLLEELAAAEPRIRVCPQSNCGVASARNRGLSLARGKYVTFIDQDDLLHPLALERLYAVFAATPVDAVSARAVDFLTTGGARKFCAAETGTGAYAVSEDPPSDVLRPRSGSPGVRASVWARGYLREAIAGISFPDGVFGADDWVFTMRVMSKIARHAMLDDVVYLHRSHPGNISSALPMRYILAMLGAVETIASEWCDAADGPHVPRAGFARALSSHVHLWGMMLPCLKKYPAAETKELSAALLRLRRAGLMPFTSVGHAMRYFCVRHGLKSLVPLFWRKRFRTMAKARANHAEEIG